MSATMFYEALFAVEVDTILMCIKLFPKGTFVV